MAKIVSLADRRPKSDRTSEESTESQQGSRRPPLADAQRRHFASLPELDINRVQRMYGVIDTLTREMDKFQLARACAEYQPTVDGYPDEQVIRLANESPEWMWSEKPAFFLLLLRQLHGRDLISGLARVKYGDPDEDDPVVPE